MKTLVATLLIFALALAACGASVPAPAPHPTAALAPTDTPIPTIALPSSYQVTYRVTTPPPCGVFGVTYSLPAGTSQMDVKVCQERDVIDTFTAKHGDALYLAAQHQSGGNSRKKFSCQILVNGMVVSEAESVGLGKIASCSASVK